MNVYASCFIVVVVVVVVIIIMSSFDNDTMSSDRSTYLGKSFNFGDP